MKANDSFGVLNEHWIAQWSW